MNNFNPAQALARIQSVDILRVEADSENLCTSCLNGIENSFSNLGKI